MEGIKTRNLLSSQEFLVSRNIVSDEQEGSYMPFLLRSVMPDARLTFPLYLKMFDKNTNKIKYLPFCEENEVFQDEWLKQVKQKGFDRLYFHKECLDKVIAYLNNFLLCLDQEGTEDAKLIVIYDHLNFTLHRLSASPNFGSNVQSAVQQAETILVALEQESFTLSSLWNVICTEYHLYNHSVNVFLITSAFMLYLKKNFKDMRSLAVAALLHDIGLLKIPTEIIYKKGVFNANEVSVMQKHPRLGFEMLRDCDVITMESQRLVLEHHENRDGSGYPQGLEFWQQHPYTQILRMVDAYDALTSYRPHRTALSASAALEILLKQKGPRGHVFDQALLKTFIKFLAH